jgi:hypothetical protein
MKYYHVLRLASRHYPLPYSVPNCSCSGGQIPFLRDSPFLPRQPPLHFSCKWTGDGTHGTNAGSLECDPIVLSGAGSITLLEINQEIKID